MRILGRWPRGYAALAVGLMTAWSGCVTAPPDSGPGTVAPPPDSRGAAPAEDSSGIQTLPPRETPGEDPLPDTPAEAESATYGEAAVREHEGELGGEPVEPTGPDRGDVEPDPRDARREKRQQAFTPKLLHRRAFRVTIEGAPVGYAVSQVDEWHMGHTRVTQFDRFLFAEPSRSTGFALFAKVRHSETQGRPNAWFGHGSTGQHRFEFRFSGASPARFEGRWLGGVRTPQAVAVPKEGYVLAGRMWNGLLELSERDPAVRGAVNLYAWQAEPREWRRVIWESEGPDPVTIEGGATEEGTRWRVIDAQCPDIFALVWLDRNANLLKKIIPALHLEFLPYASEERARDAEWVSWEQARQRWHLTASDWFERELLAHFRALRQTGEVDYSQPCYPEGLLSLWFF